jgi:hypothetical protein
LVREINLMWTWGLYSFDSGQEPMTCWCEPWGPIKEREFLDYNVSKIGIRFESHSIYGCLKNLLCYPRVLAENPYEGTLCISGSQILNQYVTKRNKKNCLIGSKYTYNLSSLEIN